MTEEGDIACAIEAVAKAFRIPPAKLLSRSRQRELAEARWMLMRILRSSRRTLQQVKKIVRKGHHKTVMHGIKRSEELELLDAIYKSKCDMATEAYLTSRIDKLIQ